MAPAAAGAQIVFSRRVYAERGQTYQQLWEWSGPGKAAPLTHSRRDHYQPMSSRDGKRILFVTGSTEWEPTGVWSFDRATRQERQVLAGRYTLLGTARDGAPLVTKDREMVAEEQKQDVYRAGAKPVRLVSACGAAVSPDGLRLAYHECGGAGLLLTGTAAGQAAGQAAVRLGECARPAWSRDGRRIACTAGQNIVVIDAVTKREVERVRFHGLAMPPGAAMAESPPEGLAWAPDGTALLVATLGRRSGSSSPQSDFFVLEVGEKSWIAAGSGNDAVWVPGRKAIVFSTPKELKPLGTGGHEVWTSHLAVFDVGTRRQTVVTSGTTYDVQPAGGLGADRGRGTGSKEPGARGRSAAAQQ